MEVVEPLCTTIRGADGSPVYVSNADVASCVVKNLSRKRA